MKWKNNCCLFERFFKIQKNGVFLFGISFSFRFSDIDVKSRRLNCRSGFPVVYARSKTFYLLFHSPVHFRPRLNSKSGWKRSNSHSSRRRSWCVRARKSWAPVIATSRNIAKKKTAQSRHEAHILTHISRHVHTRRNREVELEQALRLLVLYRRTWRRKKAICDWHSSRTSLIMACF